MAIDNFVQTFADLEVFRGLEAERIAEIVRACERIVFRPGQTIIKAGQAGDCGIVIVAGDAVVLSDHPGGQEIDVRAGSLVGETAMLIEHDYKITVVARSSVRALRITRQALHGLMLADPPLADHFVARLASRLSRVAIELRRIDEMLALASETAGSRGLSPEHSPRPDNAGHSPSTH